MDFQFQPQAKIGEEGVKRFCLWYKQKHPGHRIEVAEFREDKSGTDILIHAKGKTTKLQIKTDDKGCLGQGRGTGNFFLETISDEARGAPGLLYKCNADKLVYIFSGSWDLYVCDMQKVRTAFCSLWIRRPRLPVPNRDKETGRQWVTIGITVSISEFLDACEAKKYNLCERFTLG